MVIVDENFLPILAEIIKLIQWQSHNFDCFVKFFGYSVKTTLSLQGVKRHTYFIFMEMAVETLNQRLQKAVPMINTEIASFVEKMVDLLIRLD